MKQYLKVGNYAFTKTGYLCFIPLRVNNGIFDTCAKIPINYYWPFRFFFITLQVVIAHIITNR